MRLLDARSAEPDARDSARADGDAGSAAWMDAVARVLLNLDEFITRE